MLVKIYNTAQIREIKILLLFGCLVLSNLTALEKTQILRYRFLFQLQPSDVPETATQIHLIVQVSNPLQASPVFDQGSQMCH